MYNESGGRLGTGSIFFNRTALSFLQGRSNRVNIATSGGGLTIVAEVKFSGTAGRHERIVDLGSTLDRYYDSIVLSRWQMTSEIYVAITNKVSAMHACICNFWGHVASMLCIHAADCFDAGCPRLTMYKRAPRWQAVEVCQLRSGDGAIVQDEWMTIAAEYDGGANTVTLLKNGVILAGPADCQENPTNRSVTISYVGKSAFTEDANLHGEMRELYVAAEPLRNLSRTCQSIVCSTLQSSTWTAEAGNQYFRDQAIRGVGASHSAEAAKAADGLVGTCSQTWRENSPWWRVDLEEQRLVVSLRVYGRTDCCQADLEGFEVRVGNQPTWDKNPVCATGQGAPTNSQGVDVMCQAEGRYVFVGLPGTNRTLVLCDVQVIGLSNAASSTVINGLIPQCTACISGMPLLLLSQALYLPACLGSYAWCARVSIGG